MRFDILTVFPEVFEQYFAVSILNRARKRKIISIGIHGLRKWGMGRHHQLDDKPYGGGAGMVLQAGPILKAVRALRRSKPSSRATLGPSSSRGQAEGKQEARSKKAKVILLSAKGKLFNQKLAYQWAQNLDQLILISGRYEGIDERVKQVLKAEEISIGPYVLTDGDVAAMAVVSAVARLIPGAIKLESLQEESHWNLLLRGEKELAARGGGLEYPHYTRPEVLSFGGRRYRVPRVLLSGDHRKIAAWRSQYTK